MYMRTFRVGGAFEYREFSGRTKTISEGWNFLFFLIRKNQRISRGNSVSLPPACA